MTSHPSVVVGLDIGTGGARAVALDFDGEILAEGAARLPDIISSARWAVAMTDSSPHWSYSPCYGS